MTGTAAVEPVRHELNTSFAWEPTTGPFRIVTPEQARQYDELGFFLLEGTLDPAVVAAAAAEIDPFEEELTGFLRQLEGGKAFIARAEEITFTTHLVGRSDLLRTFVAQQALVDVCHDLIGPDVRLYWDQAVYKKPGTESPFPWHQDNGYTYIEPQQYLTCWVPLTPATVDNGCPRVVPGLHRRGTLAHRSSELGYVCLDESVEGTAVEAQVGDVVVFSSLTPHCTGPNVSDGVRKSYIVQYAPDGAEALRPDGNGGVTREPAADAVRQFPVLIDGRRVDSVAG